MVDSSERPWAIPEVSAPSQSLGATQPSPSSAGSQLPVGHQFVETEEPAAPVPRPFRLQPLTIPEILDGAFGILRASPAKVVALAATFSAPIDLFLAYINRDALANDGVFGDLGVLLDPNASEDGSTFGTDFAIDYLLPQFALVFLAAALAKLVLDWFNGYDPSYREVVTHVGRRWWKILGVWILVHLAEAVGFVLLVVPGLFVMVMFLMSIPVLITEDLGVVAALKRSRTLAKGIGTRVFGVALSSALVIFGIQLALGILPLILGSLIGETYGWLVVALGSLFTSILALVGTAGITLILYYDTRVRREGLDLAIEVQEIFGGER